MINRNFKDFKFQHKRNKNQVLFTSEKIKDDSEILNLINNFLKEKNSFIFESVEKGIIKGRYTIFGKKPDKIWEFNNNNSYSINSKNKKVKLNGAPKKIIENLIENFKFKTPESLPPICSLLSGYFSYDTIRYIEKIPNKCKDDLNLPDVRILRPRILIIHDNLKKKIFFIFNVFKDEKITNYKKKYLEIKKELTTLITLTKLKTNYITSKIETKKISVKSNTSKKKFLSMINKAKKYIKVGDIFQVVLSQRFEAKLTKNPLEIYKKLRITNPSPFMYFFNFHDFQIIGASPEILVRLRDNKITIRPIAGTRPRGINKKQSMLDTMLAGFPAGTVTGAPKIRAMEIIDELEKCKRKMYAGSIGYFSADKNFDTCIALRTALIKNNKFYIQSGAGIVADSVPEKEYFETVNKAKALISALS